LTIALIASGISRVIAIIVGLVSGYKGGTVDTVLMSINDSFVVMPLLPILILIASVIRENLNMVTLGIILSLFWMGMGCEGNKVTNTQSTEKGNHIHSYTIRDKDIQSSSKRILSIHNPDNICNVN